MKLTMYWFINMIETFVEAEGLGGRSGGLLISHTPSKSLPFDEGKDATEDHFIISFRCGGGYACQTFSALLACRCSSA